MRELWNSRYNSPDYAYGEAPNSFFEEVLDDLKPGNLLLPAEGEGRNAVYAASMGWQVKAFDFSEVGKKKAMLLADKKKVSIDYEVCHAHDFKTEEKFDVIALIYAHFAPDTRAALNAKLLSMLKPGGYLILEGFSKNQLNFGTGGPPVLEMLYNTTEIKREFPGIEFNILEELIHEMSEGTYHKGEGSIVRAFGKKL